MSKKFGCGVVKKHKDIVPSGVEMKLSLHINMEKRHILEAYALISPFLIGFALFFAFPLATSFRLSFSSLVKLSGFKMEWLGFDNYLRAFVWDLSFVPTFFGVVRDTLLNTPLVVVFSLILAIITNRKIRFRSFFRGVFFLPFLLGAGYIMQQLLGIGVDDKAMSLARGILMPEELLQYMGPGVINAIGEFFSRITMVLWKSGVQILLFLSALQTIPVSLYESSKCDGATEWEMFWMITLPMVTPVILLNIVYTIIDSFTDITNPIVEYINELGFVGNQFPYAAAIGWIYFAFVMLVIFLVFKSMKRFIRNVSEK